MSIKKFKIGRTKITLVGKFRYSKSQREDLQASFTTWRRWSLGIWFKRNKMVGSKNFNKPDKWGEHLVNDYMLGVDLIIFVGWINWHTGGMELTLN